MTKSAFNQWLRVQYPRGANQINRAAFLAAFNATARLYGAATITDGRVNNWLSRQPPTEWAGMSFAEFLAQVAKIEVMDVARIYRISVPVDRAQMEALERIGAQGTSVEDFLRCILIAAIDDELETAADTRQ